MNVATEHRSDIQRSWRFSGALAQRPGRTSMPIDKRNLATAEEQPAYEVPRDPRFNDLTGIRYGRLVVASFSGRKGRRKFWNCLCDCGKYKRIDGQSLVRGVTSSCGCLAKELTSARSSTHGDSQCCSSSKNKGVQTNFYSIWQGLRNRCNNPTNKDYFRYGARGLEVSPEFLNYEYFKEYILKELGVRPSVEHTIDRIDNTKGYLLGNLRWATVKEQARNRSSTKLVILQGETMSLSEASERYGINYVTAYGRLERGWSPERTFTTPVGNNHGRRNSR